MSPIGNHSKITDPHKSNAARLSAGFAGDAVRIRRQYKSPDYYEAKAQLMLRITEITANPDVIVRFFNLATTWLRLASEARQEAPQKGGFKSGAAESPVPRSSGARDPIAGFSELSAAKDA